MQRGLCMWKARDLGLQYNKLQVDVIECVLLAVSCACKFARISSLFLLLNFLAGTNTMLADIPTYSVLDFS